MKRIAMLSLVLAGCSSAATLPAVIAPWSVAEGMKGPESAYLDPATGWLFVSQVAGGPLDKDGNGRISKLSVDGKVLAADWATGLNAPKGLRSAGGTLWVADIDEVVGFEIATGKSCCRVKVEGAKFLNDVAVGPDGSVYVSDMLLSRIYRVSGGKAELLAEGDDLEYPNGLLAEGASLVVAAWGKPSEDFSTKVPGRLYRLDLATKKKTLITKDPVGNLDGVESDGRGGWVVTDWIAGKVLHVSAAGAVKTLLELKKGTADHAYLPSHRLLILPHMLEDRTAAYDLSGKLP
jgi:sugar lactone lactonase YvrE